MTKHTTTRREFLQTAAKAGAFLALGFNSKGLLAAVGGVETAGTTAAETELNTFLLITPDNKITIFNPRPEMGQGTWQSMPALIAEELELTLDMVDIRITTGEAKYGEQWTGGSSSVRNSWIPLRKAGAAAREMLLQAAANRWKVPVAECTAADAHVHHKASGKSLTYGELVADAAQLPVPAEPRLKDPKNFRILGKTSQRPDIPSKVNGSAKFGIDAQVPGMLYASVQHCPVIHGKVKSFNADDVARMPGVKHVIKTERKMPHKAVEAVAVLATNYWAAIKGRNALQIEWDNSGFDQVSTDSYFEAARQKVQEEGFPYPDGTGDVKKAFQTGAKIVEAQYETPFASHAPIEPINATAWVQGDKVEIWAPIQAIDGIIGEVSGYLSIPAENVKVNALYMGGSFGRKGYNDFVLEAVHISKQVQAPVKMIWTREDDLNNGPYRPGMLNALKGALDARGNLIGWEHKVIGASIAHQAFKEDLTGKPDGWSNDGINQEMSPYDIPNRRQAHILVDTDIPIVWWRSVYASTNIFGHECFMDEMAHAAGKDPLDFRLALLKNQPRWTALLKALEAKSNYRKERAAGKAIGIAVSNCFGSTAAWAITVSKKGNGVKIEKCVGVIDCGSTVSPDNVKAQTEGNAVLALSAAIKPGITVADGETQESNFHQYPMVNIRETPPIEVFIMDSKENPGGVGEPGLPPFTPALFNAIFIATKKRIRRLPVDLENL